jgi:hypothetical protein
VLAAAEQARLTQSRAQAWVEEQATAQAADAASLATDAEVLVKASAAAAAATASATDLDAADSDDGIGAGLTTTTRWQDVAGTNEYLAHVAAVNSESARSTEYAVANQYMVPSPDDADAAAPCTGIVVSAVASEYMVPSPGDADVDLAASADRNAPSPVESTGGQTVYDLATAKPVSPWLWCGGTRLLCEG